MSNFFKIVAEVLAATLVALGIIGGLLSLPEKLKAFRKARRPLGNKGTASIVLRRENGAERTTVTFLVAEDLFHFLSSYGKAKLNASIQEVSAVGEYYMVVIIYPNSVVDSLFVGRKEKT